MQESNEYAAKNKIFVANRRQISPMENLRFRHIYIWLYCQCVLALGNSQHITIMRYRKRRLFGTKKTTFLKKKWINSSPNFQSSCNRKTFSTPKAFIWIWDYHGSPMQQFMTNRPVCWITHVWKQNFSKIKCFWMSLQVKMREIDILKSLANFWKRHGNTGRSFLWKLL